MLVLPGQVSKLGVDRAGHHLCVDCMELVHTITESNDLSGADKCAAKESKAHSQPQERMWYDTRCVPGIYSQVQRIKEKDQIFPFVVCQLQLLEFTVNDSGSLPVWRRLGN